MKRVILDIPDDQAMGLAQLCKRFCWEDAVRFANPHDGGRQRALREAGLRRRLLASMPRRRRCYGAGRYN